MRDEIAVNATASNLHKGHHRAVVAVLSDVPVEATDLGGGLLPCDSDTVNAQLQVLNFHHGFTDVQPVVCAVKDQRFEVWIWHTAMLGVIRALSLRLFCGFLEDVKGALE